MIIVTSLGPQSAALLHMLGKRQLVTYWIASGTATEYQKLLIDRYRVFVTNPVRGVTKREVVASLIKEYRADVWFTGIRRCQTPERAEMLGVQEHLGAIRIAPMFEWSDEQVLAYIEKHGLPHEPLPPTKVECGLHTED